MPYIKEEHREKFSGSINDIVSEIDFISSTQLVDKAGLLNYIFTKLIVETYGPIEKLKYKDFNEIIGIYESSKLEFYRKMVGPYEDLKERDNGQVIFEDFINTVKKSDGEKLIDTNINKAQKEKFWIMVENEYCLHQLHETCFGTLFIDRKDYYLKKGDSGVTKYGEHMSVYTKEPDKKYSKVYFNNLDLSKYILIPDNLIDSLIKTQRNIFDLARELLNEK